MLEWVGEEAFEYVKVPYVCNGGKANVKDLPTFSCTLFFLQPTSSTHSETRVVFN